MSARRVATRLPGKPDWMEKTRFSASTSGAKPTWDCPGCGAEIPEKTMDREEFRLRHLKECPCLK